ncbi:hypothetical protein CCP2SC5_160014 [Azospirillaceae bacterium]
MKIIFVCSTKDGKVQAVRHKLGFSVMDGRADKNDDKNRNSHADAALFPRHWLWECNALGLLTWVSDRYAALTGASPDTVLGRNLKDMLLRGDDMETDEEADEKHLNQALDAQEPFFDLTLMMSASPKHTICIRCSGLPVFDANGAFSGYRGSASNVTETLKRERAWRDLAHVNHLLSSAIDASIVGVTIIDAVAPGYPLIYVNKAFCAMTGYKLSEAIGQPGNFFYDPNVDSTAVAKLNNAMIAGEPTQTEILYQCRNGQSMWVEYVLSPIFTQDSLSAFIGFHNDITQKKAEQRVNQDRQKLEALGQLAAGVSHEINNLLQPVISFTEITLNSLSEDQEGLRRRLGKVLNNAERAREVVRNVLMFSRTAGDEIGPVEIVGALRDALDFVRALLPATVNIIVDGLESLSGNAVVNPTEITQVLANLATNAAYAMGGKGIIRFELRTTCVSADGARALDVTPGEFYAVAVRDAGAGIKPENMARLFEPFFTTKPPGQGTGLGMSVVYGIVKGWRGAITVDSAPGRGTTVMIYVPRSLQLSS